MPIKSTNREIHPLILKKISIDKIKNTNKNIYNTREYLACKTENKIASEIYHDTSGHLRIEPMYGFYAPIDFILSNADLGIKIFIELKSRNGDDQYTSCMIGKTKVNTIIAEELFPTYVINTWGDKTYIYVIDDPSFFSRYKHTSFEGYKNLYIPKEDCFNYTEFINRLYTKVRMKQCIQSLNCQLIIP